MPHYRIAESAGKLWWNRVADHSRHGFPSHLFIRRPEGVSSREALQQSRLSKGDRSILLRVPKTPVPNSIAKCGHRRRRLRPPHPPVDRMVACALLLLVALEEQA